MATGEKKWNRPWSMDEMIENAENWSLAGDVALLNTLKAYTDNMFEKTLSISDNVDNLLHNLDEVSLKLNLSQNEFQSLRNTQFIESRVYEEDETLDYKEEVKPEQKELSEEEKENLMRDSVLEGLRVMDKYFEKVEVAISDSDDEESDKSYILRPKDIYAHRPLPYIIGSEEWYKKWHVGLASSSSESESEKVSETYSESESGDDLPKDLIKGSETSSEIDFSSRTSESRPVANSTFNETSTRRNMLESDEESDGQGSLPVKTPISSKSFAEQLAAKLGDVISEREDISPVINKKPIQPAQKSKFADVLFSDEPPPLDDLEDTILPKSAQEGIFSGGKGLFDDNEDDLFWGQQSKAPSAKPPDVKRDVEDRAVASTSHMPTTSQVRKGPFDSDDSSDEDIFATKPKKVTKQPFLQPYSTAAPLFDEEPPELEVDKKPADDTLKKKPVGGVSIFGKSDIFSDGNVSGLLKSRQQDSVDSSKVEDKAKEPITQAVRSTEENVKSKQPNLFDEDEDKTVQTVPVAVPRQLKKTSLFDDEETKAASSTNPKKPSLFDDDDDLFKDDLFSGITSKKLTSNLFEDFEDNTESIFSSNISKKDVPKVDLFSDLADVEDEPVSKETTVQKSEEKPKKKLDLFDTEAEEDLFVVKESPPSIPAVSLDDEVDKGVGKTVEDLPQRQVIGAEKLLTEHKTVKGLFDDSPENTDTEDIFKGLGVGKVEDKSDLFGESPVSETDKSNAESPQTVERGPKHTTHLQPADVKPEKSNVSEKTESKNTINLFGSSPPPDDDDWDTKSVPSSDNEDQFSYRVDYNASGSSLFDNEPPVLGPNESSGIVRDEENVTRVDTDVSSFYPYASSSRRLSSDIFSDQQSQDSFYVTKNKTESVSVPPLNRIPETEKTSYLDITPSGKLEDLESTEESSSAVSDNSVFLNDPKSNTSASKKLVSLFDDEFDNSMDAEDLFSSISKSSSAPKLSEKRTSLFDNVDDFLEEKSTAAREKTTNKVDELLKKVESKEKETDPAKTVESSETGTGNVTGIKKEKTVPVTDVESSKPGMGNVIGTKEEKSVAAKTVESSGLGTGNVTGIKEEKTIPEKTGTGNLTGTKEETTIPAKTVESSEPGTGNVIGSKKEKIPPKTFESSIPRAGTVTSTEIKQKDTKKPTAGSPGKLKHNLKINVAALLPGSAPPKPKELKKSHSLDLPKERVATPTDLSSPEPGFFTPTVSSPPRNISSTSSEKAVSFEDALDNVEVLQSVTKDRAKIPIKRRPSTRRGRQQAIQSVVSDFTLASGDNVTVGSSETKEIKSQEDKPGVQKPGDLSDLAPPSEDVKTPQYQTPTSDMDQLTSNILDDIKKDEADASNINASVFEEIKPIDKRKIDVKPANKKVTEDNLEDEEDLFGKPSGRNAGVLGMAKPKSSIFESEDSDDELFGQADTKKAKKEGLGKKFDGVRNKPLFNDSSSDEDLFSGTGSDSRKKENVQRVMERKAQKTSTMRKLENIEADEDPLSSLLSDSQK